jgi:hypothetical protein
MSAKWHFDGLHLAVGGIQGSIKLYSMKKKSLVVNSELLEEYE